MPQLYVQVEDTSPVLEYSSSWEAGSSAEDSSVDLYTEASFRYTSTEGSTAKLSFNGSAVSVMGAKRFNHGLYSIAIDSTTFPSVNGSSAPDVFNQTLFANDTLDKGSHTLTLTNEQAAFTDVDYISVVTEFGLSSESLIVNTFHDTHPSFVYTPSSAWYTPAMASSFLGSSGHATETDSAIMSFTFQVSDGVALYGPVGPNQTSSYVVQVDNGELHEFTSQYIYFRPQQLIYLATNLGGGSHMLTMRLGSLDGGELAVDYANVYTAHSLGGSFGVFPTTRDTRGVPISILAFLHALPGDIIAALAILSILVVTSGVVFGSLLYCHLKRSRKTSKRASPE